MERLDMVKDPVLKTLVTLSGPMAVGFFFNTMYNITDSYFASKLGEKVLTGVSLSFPIYMFLFAIGSGFSRSVNSLVANSLGSKNETMATRYFLNGIFLAVVISFLSSFFIYSQLERIFDFFHLSPESKAEGMKYVAVFTLAGGPLFMVMSMVFNASFTARGHVKIYRNILVWSFFINAVLDPIFAFGLHFNGFVLIPPLGGGGIALSTAFIQFLNGIILLYVMVKKKMLRIKSAEDLVPRLSYMGEILSQSAAGITGMLGVSFALFVNNKFISMFGEAGVGAYGLAIRIEQIALIPTFGLSVALIAIIGQNNGAKEYGRIRPIFRSSLFLGLLIMVIFAIPMMFFSPYILSFFTDKPEFIQLGTQYLRIQIFSFYAYVISNQANSVLQGIKKPMFTIYNEIFRQFILSFVLLYLFIYVFHLGLLGVWLSIVAKAWISAIMVLLWVGYQFKKLENSQDGGSQDTEKKEVELIYEGPIDHDEQALGVDFEER